MDRTSRWHTAGRLGALALLAAAWTGAAAQGAPAAGPGQGWVPLPSGGRLYYQVAGTAGDTPAPCSGPPRSRRSPANTR